MMKTRLFTVCYALLLSAACALAEDYTRYYTDLPVDVKQVTGPQIPDRSVCLTDFGAVGNGLTLCTDAFARAIAALESQGGGRLVVPEGVWLTGPIELKSNIDLHLEQNALIYFSPDKRLYTGHLDSRGRCMPCISADGCHDIAITGKGTIDGNGGDWHYAKRISGNEDFLIQSCKVCHAHGGFVLGSNIAAGMRRIVCRHSTFTQTDTGLRFKSFIGRGGKTEQMFISDIMMSDIVHEAIVFHCDYADQAPGDTKKLFLDPAYVDSFSAEDKVWTPDFQDIHIDRIVCRGANTGIKASGLTGLNCVHDIYVRNSLFVYNSTAQDIHEPTAKIKLTDVTFVPNSISQSMR